MNDKDYLALELTKIIGEGNPTELFETFSYFSKALLGLDDPETIDKLKEENEKLRKALEKKMSSQENLTNVKREKLRNYISEHSGDMEPYVYSGIICILDELI